jgi:hypothetical protein
VEQMRRSPSAGLSPLPEFSACASARLLRNQNSWAACDFCDQKRTKIEGKTRPWEHFVADRERPLRDALAMSFLMSLGHLQWRAHYTTSPFLQYNTDIPFVSHRAYILRQIAIPLHSITYALNHRHYEFGANQRTDQGRFVKVSGHSSCI